MKGQVRNETLVGFSKVLSSKKKLEGGRINLSREHAKISPPKPSSQFLRLEGKGADSRIAGKCAGALSEREKNRDCFIMSAFYMDAVNARQSKNPRRNEGFLMLARR